MFVLKWSVMFWTFCDGFGVNFVKLRSISFRFGEFNRIFEVFVKVFESVRDSCESGLNQKILEFEF